MSIRIKLTNNNITKCIVVYGPGEHDRATANDRFWRMLQEIYEDRSREKKFLSIPELVIMQRV